jgi:hypothetical protein
MQTVTYISGAQFYNRIRKVRTVVYEPDDQATDIEISRRLVTMEAMAVTTYRLLSAKEVVDSDLSSCQLLSVSHCSPCSAK